MEHAAALCQRIHKRDRRQHWLVYMGHYPDGTGLAKGCVSELRNFPRQQQ